MQKLLAAMMVLIGLNPGVGLACFPLTNAALKATSWSISKSSRGADLTVVLLNMGNFGSPSVSGATGLVTFVTATGEKFELELELETAIAPGAMVEQHYNVVGWDRLLSIPPAQVAVTTCVGTMEFVDGGTVIFN